MSLSPVDTRQCSATSPALYGCSHVRKFSRVDSVRQGVALLIPSVALCYVTISFGPSPALCVAPPPVLLFRSVPSFLLLRPACSRLP